MSHPIVASSHILTVTDVCRFRWRRTTTNRTAVSIARKEGPSQKSYARRLLAPGFYFAATSCQNPLHVANQVLLREMHPQKRTRLQTSIKVGQIPWPLKLCYTQIQPVLAVVVLFSFEKCVYSSVCIQRIAGAGRIPQSLALSGLETPDRMNFASSRKPDLSVWLP